MIFVTVGTHEQQFDRLVRAVDDLVAGGILNESVLIQTGYCNYRPTNCKFKKFLSFEEMTTYMHDADVVITHGGPSSFIEAMAAGRVPVVVPRKSCYGEHVNDHQVDFVRRIAQCKGGIIPCYDIESLADSITQARLGFRSLGFTPHNDEFCKLLNLAIRNL